MSDTLHGIDVVDHYRWLEDGDASTVQRWVADQNRYTREALDAQPERGRWHERLVAFMGLADVGATSIRSTADGLAVIGIERRAAAEQSVLVRRPLDELSGEPVVLFDPVAAFGDQTYAIDWFHPSIDGTLVAVGVSRGGTEDSTLRVLDVQATLARAEATFLKDEIPNTRACSLSWDHDGAGFLYTRYPAGDEYNRTVFAHRLGQDPATDPTVWAEHATPQTWPSVDVSLDSRWVMVHAMVGWGRDDVYVLDRRSDRPTWVTVVEGADATSQFVFDRDGDGIVGMTTLDAPNGRIVKAVLDNPDVWTTVIAERDVVVGAPCVAGDEVLIVSTSNAVDHLERWTIAGEHRGTADFGFATIGSVSADAETGRSVAVVSAFDQPSRVVDVSVGAVMSRSPSVAAAAVPDLAVSQVAYSSLDGTEVSMFLIHRSDVTPTAETPAILNGYGGFAIALTPGWSPTIAAWCEGGGLYAIAGLRGGIERGQKWHDAGRRANKQNVFDDFAAAADFLVDTGRTSRDRLAIDGRSNGGLLVGVSLTQRPNMCAAVSCGVPLLDMVRYPQFLIARLWTDEYGDPDIEKEFRWLYDYSPYHHVVDGAEYPATFLWAADGDTRVDPLHARKMTAALQAATTGGPVLLRQETEAGHGVGKPVSQRADEQADVLAFFSEHLAGAVGAVTS